MPRTQRRQMVLDEIVKFISVHGFSPTVRELADACDLTSTSTVQNHLYNLQRDGKIRWSRKSARTIVVIQEENSTNDAA